MADGVIIDIVVANGQNKVHKAVEHGVELITSANGQVAKAATAVHAAAAVPFAPELVAPILQRNFEVVDYAVANADAKAGMRPVVVPVVIKVTLSGTLTTFENGVKVPSSESGPRL